MFPQIDKSYTNMHGERENVISLLLKYYYMKMKKKETKSKHTKVLILIIS